MMTNKRNTLYYKRVTCEIMLRTFIFFYKSIVTQKMKRTKKNKSLFIVSINRTKTYDPIKREEMNEPIKYFRLYC